MTLKTTVVLLAFILTCSGNIVGQETEITAQQIVQRSIDSSGGDVKFDSLHATEIFTQLITSDNETLLMSVKRMNFNKYTIGVMSDSHVNTTTIYNDGVAVSIEGDFVKRITDEQKLEELKLQCFVSLDYGYKKLGYKLSRLDDQKFQNFDCYAVLAESPLGRKTANYYDKKTGRLIMVIYSGEHRAVYTHSKQSKGITIPSNILLTDGMEKIIESSLQRVNYDNDMDSYWFNIPREGRHDVPEKFKMGTFKYFKSNAEAIVERNEDSQTELTDKQKLKYRVEWKGKNDYILYDLNNLTNSTTDDSQVYIKVKIINWDENRYYCQYFTSYNLVGTCAFEKLK
jgi:hypothetical protein